MIFSTFSFLPGDFATEILGQSATKSAVKAFALGWFSLNVDSAISSLSKPAITPIPQFCNPVDRPPAPQNKSKADNVIDETKLKFFLYQMYNRTQTFLKEL